MQHLPFLICLLAFMSLMGWVVFGPEIRVSLNNRKERNSWRKAKRVPR
jgi:hypothetical protein